MISLTWRDAGARWQFDNLSMSRISAPEQSQSALGDRSAAVIHLDSPRCLSSITTAYHCMLACGFQPKVWSWSYVLPSQGAPSTNSVRVRDGPGSPPLDPILAIRIALPGPVQLLPPGASCDMSLAGPSVAGSRWSSVPLFERCSIAQRLLDCALAGSQLELRTGPRG